MKRIISDMKEECQGRTKQDHTCFAPAIWEDKFHNAWCRHHVDQSDDKGMERGEMMYRAAAFKTIARSCRTDAEQEETELRGFMELFHPNIARDHQRMAELVRGIKIV